MSCGKRAGGGLPAVPVSFPAGLLQPGKAVGAEREIEVRGDEIIRRVGHQRRHCPSSFSHVSARMRLARGESVSYWGVPSSLPKKPIVHEAEAKAEL